ncbi:MAG: TonB-dependent receptor [Phenylobacterium sp.]|uniref:TonB-dependent receptor n=1 Tax=Phenylobacterium sp. TaxID=1871053 RepID=UPI00273166D9|nr:TonB-dependent receptor [Phenylobacterium sp.]MDP2011350.1 TonB-dependent receptor [Phenylobacterium sp.]
MKSRNSHREIALCGAALSVLVITLAGVSPALAAEAAADAADAGEVSELVVTAPIRESLEKSLAIQKEADNVVNVIAADTIGRFPDATAAGALARLPGIGVQRDQGQERYIQIRGAPTRWTTVALDGINVLGAEDRIFRFDSVPAAQISQVVLNKTLLPDMPAESLAGRVNIETFSPMSMPGFHGTFDAGGGFVDLGDGPVKQYSGRLSWANDTWGFSLIGSHYSFEQQTDNSEPRFDATGITQLRITKYIITRQTESYSAKVEYAPNDDNRFTFSHLKTEFNDFEERNQYRFQYSNAFSGTRNFQTADLVGVPLDASFEDGIYSNGVWFTVLHGEHKLSDWNIDWNLAHTSTEFNTLTPTTTQQTSTALGRPTAANALLLPSMHLQVNAIPGGVPFTTLHDTVSVGGVLTRGPQRTSLNQLSLTEEFASEFSSQLETEAVTAKFDINRDWTSFGAEATFSAGFQYDDRSQDNQSVALVRADGTVASNNRSGFNLRNVATQLGLPWNPAAYLTPNAWDTNFNFGFTANYIHNPAWAHQQQVLMAAARAANKAGTGNYAVYDFDPRSGNTVDETVASAYAMNRWKWDRHTLIAGLRAERTEVSTEGLAIAGAALVPLTFTTEETHVFPSLHYTFDYADDVKLRAAFISGAARPSLADMRASVSVNDTTQTISGGNPFLKPETAYGVDLSAEWYFAPASLLAVSAYHREIKDVLFDATTPVVDNGYDFGGVSRIGYTFDTTLNGGNGHLSGVEFVYYQPWTFLPGWTSGFGFQGSLALTKGEFETPDGATVEFPGTSDRIIGATLFYEKYGLSTRLTYQYRTDWLDEVFPSGSAANSNLYWDETTRLDLSVRYQVNDTLSLFMDANNLTNELGIRYQGQEIRPYEVESFGRKFLFGVRASF